MVGGWGGGGGGGHQMFFLIYYSPGVCLFLTALIVEWVSFRVGDLVVITMPVNGDDFSG